MRDALIAAVLAGGTLAIAYLLIHRNFAYIYLAAFCGAFLGAVLTRRAWIKNAFVVLTALFLSLTLGEVALRAIFAGDKVEAAGARYAFTKGFSEPLRRNGGPLGYAPYPDRRVRAWKTVGAERVYDAIYGIGPEGIRLTPGGDRDAPRRGTIVFFGGSYVFGEGLNDDQTLPFYFGRALDFEDDIVNLSFVGYGPHQMLRALELGLFDDLFRAPVDAVIYVASPNHVERAAGNVIWDPIGPKYVLDDGQEPHYSGPFTSIPVGWETPYHHLLQALQVARRSVVIDRLADVVISFQAESLAEKVTLFGAIVQKSAEIVRATYAAPFYVLFWDGDDEASALAERDLRDRKLILLLVSDSIPREDLAAYKIANDGHPNAAANEVLGSALADFVKLRSD